MWLLAGFLLLLAGFAALGAQVHAGRAIGFDASLLRVMRGWRNDALDVFFVFVSEIGHAWGVVPFSIALTLYLAWRRELRTSLFVALAMGGCGLLNMAFKHYFERERPQLWRWLAAEPTYSFPSGHAMGSMALAAVLTVLAWRTCWRWPVALTMAAFVLLVGLSRVYLGMHYPSDILGGWTASLAWVLAVGWVVLRSRRAPDTAGAE